ncbi:MAG: hypothetical protein KC777_04010 [Cyanobacteria bacterium HKST-UBA02]|nr:hypothetical protein [Cyanobacteria bacterium HKST-UBA02]
MPNRKMLLSIAVLLSVITLSQAPPCLAGNQKGARTNNPQYWPPALNNYYPDMELLDQDGKKIRLSSFKGKVIVIEPIGMSCPACQAFAGANRSGIRPYGGVRPQANLQSFEELLKRYTGLSLGDPRIVFVQLLLYNPSMQAPGQAEARQWANNFGLRTSAGCYVLVGKQNMVNKFSYDMIPGFQLVDRDFVLRSDSTGHNPRNNLYTHFFPMLKRVL